MKVLAAICLLAGLARQETTLKVADLDRFFGDTDGAFVLDDLNTGQYIRHNAPRCRQRFSPFSTYKIPHSLIALETGVLHDAESAIAWNRELYPPQEDWNVEPFVHWKQDQTLRTAIKYSVVWYYLEVAKPVGPARMNQYVHALKYGNEDVSGWLSKGAFWLGDTLQISAEEQVEFLKAFYTGRLPISSRSVDIVKDILVLEKAPDWNLSGKTGGGSLGGGKALGWFVGYLETKGDVYFFATNLDGPSFAAIRDRRIDVTKSILTELGLLPRPN